MKKGCVIALVIFAALVAIAIAVFYLVVYPKTMSLGTAGIIALAETAAGDYAEEYGAPPEGDHEKVLATLRGNNPAEINFLGSDIDGAVMGGKIVDLWRNPLKMHRGEGGAITFTSAGPDKEHGTDDDVTGEAFTNLMDSLEEKATEAAEKANE